MLYCDMFQQAIKQDSDAKELATAPVTEQLFLPALLALPEMLESQTEEDDLGCACQKD